MNLHNTACTLYLSVSVQSMTKYESPLDFNQEKDSLNESIQQSSTKTPCCLRKLSPAPSLPLHRHYTHTGTSGLRREDDRPCHSPPSLSPEGTQPSLNFHLFLKKNLIFFFLLFFKTKHYPKATCCKASCVGMS